MKPIETRFDGYRFRSRLEARWAVFFKTLNITYEYEKEGYDLDSLYYLPDFWLPSLDCFIEVKGVRPMGDEVVRADLLHQATMKRVYIFFGNIPLPEEIPLSESGSAWCFVDYRVLELNCCWCECPKCGALGICMCGNVALLPCKHIKGHWGCYNTPRLRAAYQAARSARFETYDR